MTRRKLESLDELIGQTIEKVGYGTDDGGDWAVIYVSGGYTIYVDEPTVYGDDES